MEIRKSKQSDLSEMLALFEQAREFMEENGNPNQWGKHYPETFIIEEDIANCTSYVCIDENKVVGTFMFFIGEDETYANIFQGEWLNDKPYGVVHRITAAVGKKGVATFCLEWCFEQCKNVRIDTHKDNIPMKKLLEKNGYTSCGIIFLNNGDERIAFQK